MESSLSRRRHDLDWLRIGAFALLILYHIGMVFVPWDYHIKTARPVPALEAPMLLLNAWRLALLFLIAGVASRFLLARSARGFAAARCRRLLPPLLFGMAVMVAPQAWIDLRVNHGYGDGFLQFWAGDYWRFDGRLGIALPTWNHLWFVVYLWVYTMLLAAAAALLPPGAGARLQRAFDALFGSWRLAVLPIVWMAGARLLEMNGFPETHALVDDWAAHLAYGFAFAFGVGLARSTPLWAGIARLWRPAGAVALLAWAGVATVNALPGPIDALGPLALPAAHCVRAVQCWGAILGLLGAAQAFLNHDHPWRAPLTEAVFPAYLIHQTIVIGVEFALRPLALPALAEFAILLPATALGCGGFVLLADRLGWLRPLAGMPRAARPVLRAATPALRT